MDLFSELCLSVSMGEAEVDSTLPVFVTDRTKRGTQVVNVSLWNCKECDIWLWLCSADCSTTSLVHNTRVCVCACPLLHADAATLALHREHRLYEPCVPHLVHIRVVLHQGNVCAGQPFTSGERMRTESFTSGHTWREREITWSKLGEGEVCFGSLSVYFRSLRVPLCLVIHQRQEVDVRGIVWGEGDAMDTTTPYILLHEIWSLTKQFIKEINAAYIQEPETMEGMIRYLGNINLAMFRLFGDGVTHHLNWVTLGPSSSEAAAQNQLC